VGAGVLDEQDTRAPAASTAMAAVNLVLTTR